MKASLFGSLSLTAAAVLFAVNALVGQENDPLRSFYQLTVYHFQTADQEKALDNYFANALLPALHRFKITNVGVFKSWANDTTTEKIIVVFIPFESRDAMGQLKDQLRRDSVYLSAAEEFLNAPYKNPPFSREEAIVIRAFPLAPQVQPPILHGPKKQRVYELRSYESPTWRMLENKIRMFNRGDEIGLFRRLNFNAIFYGEVIAGSRMPNLMYMTSFENKADRDEHWKAFGDDPYWKKLSAMPEYQNNVSHIDSNFLYPTEYSDF